VPSAAMSAMASMPGSSSMGGFTGYALESCNRRRDTQGDRKAGGEIGDVMKSRRHKQKQVTRRLRARRRLGRFVAFAEMLADLRPTSLFDQAAPFEQAGSDQGTREQGAG